MYSLLGMATDVQSGEVDLVADYTRTLEDLKTTLLELFAARICQDLCDRNDLPFSSDSVIASQPPEDLFVALICHAQDRDANFTQITVFQAWLMAEFLENLQAQYPYMHIPRIFPGVMFGNLRERRRQADTKFRIGQFAQRYIKNPDQLMLAVRFCELFDDLEMLEKELRECRDVIQGTTTQSSNQVGVRFQGITYEMKHL